MKQTRKTSNNSNTLLLITSIYNSLTKAEKKVADAVVNNPEEAIYLTVTDLSEKARVGETSVIRFCRKLGYRGYHDFKLAIAQDIVNLPDVIEGQIEESDSVEAIAQKITMNNARLLQNTLDLIRTDELKKAALAIKNSRKLYIYGVGSSGITALDAHYRFMRLGQNVEAQRDAHIISMSASLVSKGDVVLGISTSGSTRDLVDPIRQAQKNGASVICLTSHARSPITKHADCVLLVPSKEMPNQGGALSTKITHIHMLDILSSLVYLLNKDSANLSIKNTAEAVADKLY